MVDQEILDAEEHNDIEEIRNILIGMIYASRDFSDGRFDRNYNALKESIKNEIMQEKNDEKYVYGSKPDNELTDDDFARAVFNLRENFCQERIDDVRRVGRVLYGNHKRASRYNDELEHNPMKRTRNKGTGRLGGLREKMRRKTSITRSKYEQ